MINSGELLTYLWRGGEWAYYWSPDGETYTDKTGKTEQGKLSFYFPARKVPQPPAAWAEKNIYFGVHPTTIHKNGNGSRSKAQEIAAVNCLFADFDAKDFSGGKAGITNHIEKLWDHGNGLPYPSVIVDSGGGYHCYWLLENTFTIASEGDRERIKTLQATWCRIVGGDPAAKDIARILRVPGTQNHKPNYAPNYPTATIIEHDERRVFDLDTLEQFAGLDQVALAAKKATPQATHDTTDDVIITFNRTHKLIDLLRDAGYTLSFERGNQARMIRPRGTSASVVVFVEDNASFHHSSSDPLHSEHTQDAFSAWTILHHNGDKKAAYTAAKKEQGKWEEPKTTQRSTTPVAGVIEPTQPDAEAMKIRLTDLGNAWRFVVQFGSNFRYTAGRGWLAWDGKRWEKDAMGAVQRAAKATATSLYTEAAEAAREAERLATEAGNEGLTDERRATLGDLAKKRAAAAQAIVGWAKQCQGRSRIDSIVALAQSELPIAERDSVFDTDSWLLNCQNGTVNLKTGTLQPHRQVDHITTLSPSNYNPSATCPTWDKFLHRIMGGNQELIGFLRRMAGYCLTGDVSEQVLFFFYGAGSNGKTTFIKALSAVIGENYAMMGAPELLLEKKHTAHPTEIADLAGKRLVASVEVPEGARMAETLVKQLTGGDTLKARYMRENFFQFEATHKLIIGANHKPEVKGTDFAIWRRIRLVPFTETISDTEKDPQLLAKLIAESSGILAWAVRGCLEWQRIGLKAPPEVMAATEQYRTDSDTLGQFLSECTVKIDDARTKASVLYAAYQKWAAASGERHQINLMGFGQALTERGIDKEKTYQGVFYLKIGLVTDEN